MFFNILATFAEFEVDLLRIRTREGMAVARAKGKLRGKQPKLSARQQRELVRMYRTGEYAIADLAEVFTVSRARRLPHPPASRKIKPRQLARLATLHFGTASGVPGRKRSFPPMSGNERSCSSWSSENIRAAISTVRRTRITAGQRYPTKISRSLLGPR